MKEEYGIYIGKKVTRKGPLKWKWFLAKRTFSPPTDSQILDVIKKEKALRGYAMRLVPRPWKKVSRTVVLE